MIGLALTLLSYALVFAAGMATGELIVPRLVGWASGKVHHHETGECRVTQRTKGQVWGLVVVLALGVVGVGLGFMLLADQRAERRENARDAQRAAQLAETVACINKWGEDFDRALKERVKATADLREVEAARDNAVDRLVNIVARLSRQPPEATGGQYREAIEAANVASTKARVERRVTDRKLAENPYPAPPTLTCAVEEEADR